MRSTELDPKPWLSPLTMQRYHRKGGGQVFFHPRDGFAQSRASYPASRFCKLIGHSWRVLEGSLLSCHRCELIRDEDKP